MKLAFWRCDLWIFVGYPLTLLITVLKFFVIQVFIWRFNFSYVINTDIVSLLHLQLIIRRSKLRVRRSFLVSAKWLEVDRVLAESVRELRHHVFILAVRSNLINTAFVLEPIGGLALLKLVNLIRLNSAWFLIKDFASCHIFWYQILWLKKFMLPSPIQSLDACWSSWLFWFLYLLPFTISLLLNWLRVNILGAWTIYNGRCVGVEAFLQAFSIRVWGWCTSLFCLRVSTERSRVWLELIHADGGLFRNCVIALAFLIFNKLRLRNSVMLTSLQGLLVRLVSMEG